MQCTMALRKDRVWGIVSGTEDAPASDADPRRWNAMLQGETKCWPLLPFQLICLCCT